MGRTNPTQHAAFQCMWLQFDHVVPHSRGGDNSVDNVVVTCGPCNYGRAERTLDELGLIDPRQKPVQKTDWDGLERMLTIHV
jgi:5-methylcytosine-specific restriction endonuclease McrA